MQEKTKSPAPVPGTNQNYRGWQSDIIVDLIKRYGFPAITLNPGASFRGLHDSLVNYGGNEPPMMLCQHEEIAVQIAHGYAKASGKPMAVILHNLVGLLHAAMAIYYAHLDRVPIFIIGATGPMDEGRRRPHIDWTHTALVQGNAIRDYVKWDYQPTSIEGVPESFARAYSVMTTEPQGPVYMCYDAALQEDPLTREVPLPPADAVATPAPMAPDARSLESIADKLLKAEDMPWERSPDGLIKHLINHRMNSPELCVEAYMLFLKEGERSGKHRHMWEELTFVVEGSGYDLHWDMKFDCQDKFLWEWADEPRKFEWKQGDYIYVPPFTNHQHFATKEARLIVMSNRMIKEMGFDWLDQLENAPGF